MQSAQIPAAFHQAEGAFGTVDILINNSGIAVAGKLPNVSEDAWDSVIRPISRRMDDGTGSCAADDCRRDTGSIVNLASVLAFRTQKALSTYSISKAAVAQMTRAMAAELAPPVFG